MIHRISNFTIELSTENGEHSVRVWRHADGNDAVLDRFSSKEEAQELFNRVVADLNTLGESIFDGMNFQ